MREMNLILLFLQDFWLGILNLKSAKNFKKMISEEFMPVVWHPNRCWIFCMSEDEKKEIDSIFVEKL